MALGEVDCKRSKYDRIIAVPLRERTVHVHSAHRSHDIFRKSSKPIPAQALVQIVHCGEYNIRFAATASLSNLRVYLT